MNEVFTKYKAISCAVPYIDLSKSKGKLCNTFCWNGPNSSVSQAVLFQKAHTKKTAMFAKKLAEPWPKSISKDHKQFSEKKSYFCWVSQFTNAFKLNWKGKPEEPSGAFF